MASNYSSSTSAPVRLFGTTTTVVTTMATTAVQYTRVAARAGKGATVLPRPARANGNVAVGVGVSLDSYSDVAVVDLQCVSSAFNGVPVGEDGVVHARLLSADGSTVLEEGYEVANVAVPGEIAHAHLRVTFDKARLQLPCAALSEIDAVKPLVLTLAMTIYDGRRTLTTLGVDVWGMKRACVAHFNALHRGFVRVDALEEADASA